MDFLTPIREIKGVGEKTEKLYQKTGVYTVGDILLHFPRGYKRFPEVTTLNTVSDPSYEVSEPVAIIGMLKAQAVNRVSKKKMEITVATAFNDEGSFEAIWFRMPYMRSNLHTGMPYVFFGNIKKDGNKIKFEMPRIFTPEEYESKKQALESIYRLTKGLSNNSVQKTVKEALTFVSFKNDYLPENIRKERGLIEISDAVHDIHIPSDFEALSMARNRLCYDEFFRFFYFMNKSKKNDIEEENRFKPLDLEIFNSVKKSLPFELTDGQNTALSELLEDFTSDHISERMLQGDVGCGKTMVAFLSMLIFVSNGYKTAMMAPTEVLARQHEETFKEYMKEFNLPYTVLCLTGSTPASEKKEIKKILASDEPVFLIGTHAIIQKNVDIKDLALAITDEQHRFGVKQRKTIGDKGNNPFTLVMSATPIPRSLAMVLYGGMKISVIKELPKNRLPIKNAVIKTDKRDSAFKFILKELNKGHQAYIICPLIESSEKTESESIEEYKEKLKSFFSPDINIGIMHGRLKDSEKNAVMEEFANGNTNILLSTTVVEVGVNVPNATVMLIENADRFGLSQLHQLRGRVGRGKDQSYCIFMDASKKEEENQRLKVISTSNDGFFVASEDLKLRGPGDFFGIRQSGELSFTIADIYQDAEIMKKANEDVSRLLSSPDFDTEELNDYMSMYDRVTYTNL